MELVSESGGRIRISRLHGGEPSGIQLEPLIADIDMLLDGEHTNANELRAICTAIDSVNRELSVLYSLIEKHMPHRTSGSCNGLSVVGKNRLLGMLFTIQESSLSFGFGIKKVKAATERILQGKEQQSLFG